MPSFSIHKLQPANAHLTEQLRAYAYDVIGCCQVVHRDMGPFLNEYMYQEALAIAFHEANILQWGPQRKPNEVFAMGRAGSSEYSLPKRNFGTCIEDRSREFHGQPIKHKHFVDFLVRDDKKSGLPKIFNFWEEEEARPLHLLQRNLIMDRRFRREQRQQLWNYMRLTSTRIGILYNFAPVKDECERYYLDATTGMMYAF